MMATIHDHESLIAQLTAERDAAIARAERAEKALEQMVNHFEDYDIYFPNSEEGAYIFFLWEGSYRIYGHYCEYAPELTRYLCERFGLENPLETEARNA